jgi:hypothetical protein
MRFLLSDSEPPRTSWIFDVWIGVTSTLNSQPRLLISPTFTYFVPRKPVDGATSWFRIASMVTRS